MLPRRLRLSAARDYARVFRKGVSISTPFFFVRGLPTQSPTPRIGIVVSNKISKKATARNLIKRQIRAASFAHRNTINSPIDIAIVAKPSILNAGYQDIEQHLISAFSQLNSRIRS